MGEDGQRLAEIGHVVGGFERIDGAAGLVLGIDEIGERGVAEGPAPGTCRIRAEGAVDHHLVRRASQRHPGRLPRSAVMICWRPAWMASGSLLLPISRAISASLGRASACARKAGSSLPSAAAARSASIRALSQFCGLAGFCAGCRCHQVRQGEIVQSLPAGEQITFVSGNMSSIGRRLLEMQVDRCRKIAVERQDRTRDDAGEGDGLIAFDEVQNVAADFGAGG